MMNDPRHLPAQPAAPDPVAGKTVAEILGEIVWLMTQDPAGREMNISKIENTIMPAIIMKRFHISYKVITHTEGGPPKSSSLIPASVIIYSDNEKQKITNRFSATSHENEL